MNEPVVPFDLMPMFFGTDPTLFYLEIVFRTCVIYIYALLLIRWVGGRGIAQMSTVEFLLVIALGSAVGDAMFYPEVPIFHAMLVITVPIYYPIILGLGFDPIWFGVVAVIVIEMGMITPPVGLNVFVVRSVAEEVSLKTVFSGVTPFLLAMIVTLLLIVAFPQISLLIPNSMFG